MQIDLVNRTYLAANRLSDKRKLNYSFFDSEFSLKNDFENGTLEEKKTKKPQRRRTN